MESCWLWQDDITSLVFQFKSSESRQVNSVTPRISESRPWLKRNNARSIVWRWWRLDHSVWSRWKFGNFECHFEVVGSFMSPWQFLKDASAKFLNTVDTWDGQNHGGCCRCSIPCIDAKGYSWTQATFGKLRCHSRYMWTPHILSSYIQGQNMEDAGDYAKLVASLPWNLGRVEKVETWPTNVRSYAKMIGF